METKKRHPVIAVLSFLIFFAVFILHYSANIDISIKNASPLTMLPLLCAFSMFVQPPAAAFAGLVLGTAMDGVSMGAYCFNAIVLMLSAVMVSALTANLINKNIRSAILMSVLVSLFYFVMRWLVFYAFAEGAKGNLTYLLSFAFPSAVYTALFIFPFYFICRYLNKLKNE